MNSLKLRNGMILCIAAILIAAARAETSDLSGIRTWSLRFTEPASGGTLVLARNLNRTVKYVSIPTSKGESPESVVERLAGTINGYASQDTERVSYNRNMLWAGGYQVTISDGAILLPRQPGDYILAGSETGLGIPSAPSSLSCSCEGDKIVVRWINAPVEYDFIVAKIYWTDFDNEFDQRLEGGAESFTIDGKTMHIDSTDIDVRIVGVRDNIPSNAAAIHVSGSRQSELYGIPFTENIAPNWRAWRQGIDLTGQPFKRADRFPLVKGYISARNFLTKPFYQSIGAGGPGAHSGVYRRFLGLTPGHTYRLTVCASTLEMDSVAGDWSFSISGTAMRSVDKDLTARQMASLDPLPGSSRGRDARAASFGRGKTTNGEFDFRFTGEQRTGEPTVADITLPEGVDSILIWASFSCDDARGKVGLGGVALEDITANPNPVSPAEIRRKERDSEHRLWRGMQRKLQEQEPVPAN